jgi:multisubunit Na+/H+ antiporter MnhB subunit
MLRRAALAVVGIFAAALGAAIAFAVLAAPGGAGLAAAVGARLPESGVRHPVTAVLLNFRAYDTLLEIGVLLVAWIAARGLAPVPRAAPGPPPLVLDALFRLLAPVVVVFAAYLLWRGADAPGGAFQAGALLAAAAVLASLVGARLPLARLETVLASAGLAAFVAVGLAALALGGAFLAYPPGAAGALIFAIEVAATLSIAAALALLFDPGLAR